MNQQSQQQYHDPRYGATFGAEMAPLPPEARFLNLWQTARLLTPQWLKESTTIAIGVFGAMTLFRIFQRKLPKEI